MPAPDPQAAADAWLARLPQAERLAAAAATHERLAAWLGGLALVCLAAGIAARMDLAGRLWDGLRAAGVRPWLARAAASGALAALILLIDVPFGALVGWREGLTLAAGGGVPPEPGLAQRLSAAAAGALLLAACAIVLTPLLQGLMRWRPRSWPWLLGLVWTALCLWVLWAPYAAGGFAADAPAPSGPSVQALLALQSEAGLPARPITLDRSLGLDEDAQGAFGHVRIVVGPEVLAGGPAQARALVGHVMGHQAHADILAVSLVFSLAGLATLLAMQRWALPLACRLAPVRPSELADPRVLPALVLIGALGFTVGQLAEAGFLRWANVRADAYALSLTRDPNALAASLEARWDHAAVDPWPAETALFYSHPPLRPRLAGIMAWKAAPAGQ